MPMLSLEVESFLTLTPPISLRYSQYPQTMPMPAMPPMSTPDLQNLHGLDFDAQLLCALQAVPNAPCGSAPCLPFLLRCVGLLSFVSSTRMSTFGLAGHETSRQATVL